ncbi:hypothetical protein ACFFQF_11560 [Haladaptatus pallidirubidus]|uniref:hypothetical protein n=1 Tax=Haladaptatus pallidirubidus TaxID=1008152 RepID=UPI0035EA1243
MCRFARKPGRNRDRTTNGTSYLVVSGNVSVPDAAYSLETPTLVETGWGLRAPGEQQSNARETEAELRGTCELHRHRPDSGRWPERKIHAGGSSRRGSRSPGERHEPVGETKRRTIPTELRA